MNILEIHQKLLKKEISTSELLQEFFKKIEKEDKEIGAFLTVTKDLAQKEAKEAQRKIEKEGKKAPLLCGIPCAIKDNILVKDIKCTAGSKILEDYIAPYDATAIKKLKKAGAVILGKTNMDEFAMGSSTENSAFLKTKNPLEKTRVPGGSSGGSAAAVAAGFCQFSLASDTGGSIRQPAAFCGVVGLKPTYGAVSRFGLIALASSLDQIGPITKNVKDAKIVFETIKGKDPLDSTSVTPSSKNQLPNVKSFKIGIPKEYFALGIDPPLKKEIEKAIAQFEKLGFKIEKISLPHTKYALPCYHLIMDCEASANLARYDGIKYGISRSKVEKLRSKNLFEYYLAVRGKYFGKEVKRRILMGTFALSAGYYDKYYLKAQKVRTLIQEDFKKAFLDVDLILTPVSPTLPFKLGERIEDPIKMYLADIFTTPANLAGLPAISFPCGKIGRLPVALQLLGKPLNEEVIFQVAELFEKSIQSF